MLSFSKDLWYSPCMLYEKQVIFLQHVLIRYVTVGIFSRTMESRLFLEGVVALSTLIGFNGPDQPHLGPLLTLCRAQDPMSPSWDISPCPSDARTGPVSSSTQPSHGPCQAGPTRRPMSCPIMSLTCPQGGVPQCLPLG